jgi:glycosyltransferase involved in cell wall biosynthesis
MASETITVSIIGYNEAENLSRCLPALDWADEIIFVDCESEDNSLEIARRFTSKIFTRPNVRNLNINKQFGIEQSTSSWIFYLDPDEFIPPETVSWIKQTIRDAGHAAYYIPRKNFMMGSWLRHGGQYPDLQLRLFRRGRARFPCKHVHERLEVDGSVGKSSYAFFHHPYPTMQRVIDKFNFYTTFEAIFLLESRPSKFASLNYLMFKPAFRFIKRYIFYGGFMYGYAGFVAAFFDMINFPVRYLKYIELKKHHTSFDTEKTDNS